MGVRDRSWCWWLVCVCVGRGVWGGVMVEHKLPTCLALETRHKVPSVVVGGWWGAAPLSQEHRRLSGEVPYMTLPANEWVVVVVGVGVLMDQKGRRRERDEGKETGLHGEEAAAAAAAAAAHCTASALLRACDRASMSARAGTLAQPERDGEEKGKGGVLICVLCCTATALRAE